MICIRIATLCVLTCALGFAGEPNPPQEVKFTAKPVATRVGDRVKISFAVSAPTDVAVYIENAQGEVIRHLVAGVLAGANPPPAPLKPGLAQEIEWDGKADYGRSTELTAGKPAEGGAFKVRVALGLGARYDRVLHSNQPDIRLVGALTAGPDGTLYVSGSGPFGLAGSDWRAFGRDGTFQNSWDVPPGPEAARYFGWASDDGRPDPMNYKTGKYMAPGCVLRSVSGSDAAAVGRDGTDLFQIGNTAPICIYRYPLTAQDAPVIWKVSDAAVGPKFDAAGNIYLAEAVRPKGWLLPPELESYFEKKGVKAPAQGQIPGALGMAACTYGSIVKFGPKGGMVHWDKDPKKGPNGCGFEPYTGEPKPDPTLKTADVDFLGLFATRGSVKVTGAEWVHPGIGHIGFYGCNCENITFDVDEFGRTFFGDTPQFQLRVIDTAGNAIAKFGGYGGANCMGPESSVVDPRTNRVRPRRADDPKELKSPFAEPELAFKWLLGVGVTDRYAYIGDSMNQRLLRAKLVYAAEETVAVP